MYAIRSYYARFLARFVVRLLQQVADHALGARTQGIGFHVPDHAVQANGHAGEHAPGEAGVVIDLVEHGLARDMQQERIVQRFGIV